jgi:hypothetical protein
MDMQPPKIAKEVQILTSIIDKVHSAIEKCVSSFFSKH